MVYVALVIIFFTTILTGPAGLEWLNKRKLLKEQPKAKLLPFPYPPGHPRKL